MTEYGTRANNNEIVLCHWCGFPVVANETTVEVGIIGFYGHSRCWNRRKKYMTKAEIRTAEQKYRERRHLPM